MLACCYLALDNIKGAEEKIGQEGLLKSEVGSEVIKQKKAVIRELISERKENGERCDTLQKFDVINEKLRTELLGLDGAFVIDKEGNVIAVGAILAVSPGSDEGGRSAAAKELSNYGIGIKVSEDGDVTVYINRNKKLKYI